MMKLYTARFAPNPHKIRIAIAELGIACEPIEMDVRSRENRQPAFLAINPNGNLPVLDDDGFVLWESDAILVYLGRKHADRGLWPQGLRDEADAMRWLFYEIATFQPPAGEIWWERWLKPRVGAPKPADELELQRHLDELQKPLRVLDKHLVGREWMLGGTYSLVDCAYTAVLNMLAISSVTLRDYSNVASYWERLRARPSFAACPFEFPAPTP